MADHNQVAFSVLLPNVILPVCVSQSGGSSCPATRCYSASVCVSQSGGSSCPATRCYSASVCVCVTIRWLFLSCYQMLFCQCVCHNHVALPVLLPDVVLPVCVCHNQVALPVLLPDIILTLCVCVTIRWLFLSCYPMLFCPMLCVYVSQSGGSSCPATRCYVLPVCVCVTIRWLFLSCYPMLF